MEPLIQCKGTNGQLTVYPTKIVIHRKGFFASVSQGLNKGEKEVFITGISGIQLKKNSLLTKGYIQFVVSGSQEHKRGKLTDITKDENTILFPKSSEDSFIKAKEMIEDLRNKASAPQVIHQSSEADELKKLAELRDSGVLTDEEFQAKKRQILGL